MTELRIEIRGGVLQEIKCVSFDEPCKVTVIDYDNDPDGDQDVYTFTGPNKAADEKAKSDV